MLLNDRLKWLQSKRCQPALSLRGKIWRAHVNGAGNFWAEGETPFQALENAVKLWKEKGRPMDGYAV